MFSKVKSRARIAILAAALAALGAVAMHRIFRQGQDADRPHERASTELTGIQGPPEEPPPKPSIQVRVKNTYSGEPGKGIAVMVKSLATWEEHALETDDAGLTPAICVSPGEWIVSLAKSDETPAPPGGRQTPVHVEALPKLRIIDLEVALLPVIVVQGHVVKQQGGPIVGARVAVVYDPRGFSEQQKKWAKDVSIKKARANSDADGRYVIRFRGAPGGYVALALHDEFLEGPAQRIDARGGQSEHVINFILAPRPMLFVRGIVVDASGTPLAAATVRIRQETKLERGTGYDYAVGETDSDGIFVVKVDECDDALVEITHPRFKTRFVAIGAIRLGSPRENLMIRMEAKTASITVVTVDQRGGSIAGVKIEVLEIAVPDDKTSWSPQPIFVTTNDRGEAVLFVEEDVKYDFLPGDSGYERTNWGALRPLQNGERYVIELLGRD